MVKSSVKSVSVTTAWRIVRLRLQEQPPMECRCEYIE